VGRRESQEQDRDRECVHTSNWKPRRQGDGLTAAEAAFAARRALGT